DVGVISKMVSGKMPIKAGKFIKNGDVVKFKAGDYRNLTLVVNKKITLAKTGKGKVRFISDYTGTAITVKSNNVKINGLTTKNYVYDVYGKTSNSVISKMSSYGSNGIDIMGNKNKIMHNKNYFPSINVAGNYNEISYNKLEAKKNDLEIRITISVTGNNNIVKKNSLKNYSSIEVLGNKNNVSHNSLYKTNIYVANGKYNYFSYNKISKANIGINDDSLRSTFYKNTISGCYYYGIVYSKKGAKFVKNVFKGNKKNVLYSPLTFPPNPE
ncbi:MAG: hypothetical protein ACRC1M_02735, partial [Methanobacteriaceae archaeon]